MSLRQRPQISPGPEGGSGGDVKQQQQQQQQQQTSLLDTSSTSADPFAPGKCVCVSVCVCVCACVRACVCACFDLHQPSVTGLICTLTGSEVVCGLIIE